MMNEAQPHFPQALVKANVYLCTPTLVRMESSSAPCAVTLLALDGQITGEMEECGPDTTHEHSLLQRLLLHFIPSMEHLRRRLWTASTAVMTVKFKSLW